MEPYILHWLYASTCRRISLYHSPCNCGARGVFIHTLTGKKKVTSLFFGPSDAYIKVVEESACSDSQITAQLQSSYLISDYLPIHPPPVGSRQYKQCLMRLGHIIRPPLLKGATP